MDEQWWWILAFFGGFLLVFGVNYMLADFFETQRQRARQRLDEELRVRSQERARSSLAFRDAYAANVEAVDYHVRKSPIAYLGQLVEESGLSIKPRQLIIYMIVAMGITAGGAWILSKNLSVTAASAVCGALLPYAHVSFVRRSRLNKLLSQMPDAFDLMSRTMRAGQTISQALQAVADEFSPPISEEFRYCYDQQNLGLTPEAALRDLARRTGLLEIKIFVLAVMVHQQTGGNLSELLGKLSHVIRDRYRIKGAIQALTAEGRLQAIILLALPPLLMLAMFILNRSYAVTLFDYPQLLVGTAVSMAFGAFWMQKIISFDF